LTRKTVAIVQSCYVPWKGYFDLINSVNEFILYDDRQFTRRDWRNRNRIKTAQGTRWLTIPVKTKGLYHQRIDETLIGDPSWHERHWKAIVHSYAAAPCFSASSDVLEELYRTAGDPRLSVVNRHFLEGICDLLGIRTTLSWSTDYDVTGTRTDRLVALCRAAGATEYLSGPRARSYLDEEQFSAAGIKLTYFDYNGYPEYVQLHPPFDHAVSIIDLLVSTGPDARRYLKSFADALTPLGA
jgi:WbqC-like protein family